MPLNTIYFPFPKKHGELLKLKDVIFKQTSKSLKFSKSEKSQKYDNHYG